jgi:hypothetical protein
MHIAFGHEGELEVTDARTPLEELMEKEEAPSGDEVAINGAKIEAIRRLLIYCFGQGNDMLEALKQLALICYIVCPHLVEQCSLEKLAKAFDTSRQCFSKRLLKINKDLKIRGRNQKSDTAVEVYREKTKAWHKAKKAEDKATKSIERTKRKKF